jgi:hypothetical protein
MWHPEIHYRNQSYHSETPEESKIDEKFAEENN